MCIYYDYASLMMFVQINSNPSSIEICITPNLIQVKCSIKK